MRTAIKRGFSKGGIKTCVKCWQSKARMNKYPNWEKFFYQHLIQKIFINRYRRKPHLILETIWSHDRVTKSINDTRTVTTNSYVQVLLKQQRVRSERSHTRSNHVGPAVLLSKWRKVVVHRTLINVINTIGTQLNNWYCETNVLCHACASIRTQKHVIHKVLYRGELDPFQ